LGSALAFGLGGREVAAKMLSDAYQKGQEQKGQAKQDMQTGKERGQQQAEQARDKAQAKVDERGRAQADGPAGDAPRPGPGAQRR